MTKDAELWTWERVGDVPLAALDEARVVVHWAVQVVAAAGATLLPPRADMSHTALSWVRTTRAFAGEPLRGGVRAALVVEGLRLVVLRSDGTIAESFTLAERSIDDGLGWLRLALDRSTGAPVSRLERPTHPMAHHAVADGALFPLADDAGYSELARWYGDASEVLTEIAALPEASPLRCWPHHFDLATSLTLDPADTDPERARSIGVGFSPGEAGAAEPYWYVTPWPRPAVAPLSPLPLGKWHTEGWLGAMLTASEMTPDTQARTVRSFLDAAMGTIRTLLTR